MGEAMEANQPQLNGGDELFIEETHGGASKLSSGPRYVVRAPGAGDTTLQNGTKPSASITPGNSSPPRINIISKTASRRS